MEDDEVTIFDVERVILTGDITERQEDSASGEWKYVVEGFAIDDREVAVVSKIGPTDKLVIITVYASN